MPEIDLWDDTHEPVSKLAWRTYRLTIPGHESEVRLFVSVEPYGMLSLDERMSTWFHVMKTDGMFNHDTRREIYEWLKEWEFAVWKRIGPEDTELFATKKLDPDYGLEN